MKSTRLLGWLILQSSAFSLLAASEPFEKFTVQQARGSCEIISKGVPTKAQQGQAYPVGVVGKTGSQSDFTVAFDEKNRFRILPKTEVEISASTRDPRFRRVIDLTMKQGSGGVDVELDAMPKDYQLKVQTPTAVCGAVGTRFTVRAEGNQDQTFECKRGTIFARSSEDGSFNASEIHAGQTLQADVAPGKENSYTQLKTDGGPMKIALGSPENNLTVEEGSSFQLAQETTKSTQQLALKVDHGTVGGNKGGRYIVDGTDVVDAGKTEKGGGLVDDYMEAAQKEGRLNEKLKHVPEGEKAKLLTELEEAAKDATEKRKALFEYRREIRTLIRQSSGNAMRGSGRPTSRP